MITYEHCGVHKYILVESKGVGARCKGVNTHLHLEQSPAHLGSYTTYRTITNTVSQLTVG